MVSWTVRKPLFTAVWAATDLAIGHCGQLTKAQEDRKGKFGLKMNHFFYRTGSAQSLHWENSEGVRSCCH